MWKRIALVLGVFIAGFLLFALMLPLIIPTAQDAEISNAIRKNFETATASVITNRQVSIVSTPRRGKTLLIVSGSLSEPEEKTLQQLADKIGQTNGNRQVMVIFR